MTDPMKPMKPKVSLLERVTYEEHLTLADGTVVATIDVARAVADDQYPGDDAIGPQYLMRSAVHAVKWHRLRNLVREAHGALRLSPGIARDLIDAPVDDVVMLAGLALDDLVDAGAGLDDRAARFTPDGAAFVLLLGALIVEARCDVASVAKPTSEGDEGFVPNAPPRAAWLSPA
jgi:hypothetical protein